MHTNFIQYTIIIFAILSLNTCTYDKSNFKKLNQPVVIKKPIEEKEIKYINELKAKVEKLKEKNNGKIVRDAYNVFVNDDNRNDSPTKGGFIHVSFNSEPYILLTWLDNSAVTAYITDYIYDTLLYQDKETFELRPSLANSYEEYDIIWLKGKRSDNIFKEKGDNNFIIGTIDESKIKWDSTKKKILEITIKTKSGIKVINGNQLRYKHDIENPDDSNDDYIRAYDKQVVISFSLKENVKWHDGKPFTADDVLFSMDVIKNPYIIRLAHLRNNYQSLKTWVKEGNNKITFYFDKQYFKTLEYASGFTILPKHIYLPKGSTITKKEFADYFTKHEANIVKNGFGPVGTGPYYFPSKYTQKKLIDTGWVKNDRILLLRNDNYFDKKRSGNLKKLFFHFIPEHEISFLQIKKGEIDFDPSLQYTQYFNSSSTKEFKSRYVKGIYYIGAFGYIGYNMKKIYFTDRRVRTAITMLLDRERLLRTVYYNLGIIVTGSQNYFGTAYNRSVKHYPYNRQLAIDLLNKAGWIDTDGDGLRDKDGIPFVIDLLHPGKNPPIVGAFLKEELSSLGIELKLTPLEWGVFLEHLKDGKFDMFVLGWVIDSIEDDPYQIWHSSQWANQGSNRVGFSNAEADRIIIEAKRTLDTKKRKDLYFRLHEIIHEEQPYIFLYTSPYLTVYNKRFRNVKFYNVYPGWDLREWYVPKRLQTKEESKAESNKENES